MQQSNSAASQEFSESRNKPVSAPVTSRLNPQPGTTNVHHLGDALPGSSTVPEIPDRPRGVDATGEKVPFMDRAKGYAKVQAGTFFGNEKEKALGEAALRGEDVGQRH
ncbi:hypothetical protein [Phaffia rhodozyma]|uniref:Uncharacterized protein n=1 Tax=Phaffia rhodozyma TaxID=264483 RepID=A0A0F7SQS7_PHARH|nr:hypothetical protein [Phaffia rhodozyma]